MPSQAPETWRGAAAYIEGLERFNTGDLEGALTAFAAAVGTEIDHSEEERPFVAAAVVSTGSALDKLGHYEAAVRSYDLALERFANDDELLHRNEWMRAPLESVRARRDWLLQHRLGGERRPHYEVRFPNDPTDAWRPLYLDGVDELHVGEELPAALLGHERWRITCIEETPNQPNGLLGRVHVVAAD